MRLPRKIASLLKKETKKPEGIISVDSFKDIAVSKSIKSNRQLMMDTFKDCTDVLFRDLSVGRSQTDLLVVYIEEMVEKRIVDNQVLKPIMADIKPDDYPKELSAEFFKNKVLAASRISEECSFDRLLLSLLTGSTLLFIDGFSGALVIECQGGERRAVEEPGSEVTIKGPREGFVESLQSNIGMIRRIIKDPNMAVEITKVGRRTQTDVAVIYIKGIIKNEIVAEIKRKIAGVDTDSLIGSGTLEELMEEHKWSIAPQYLGTERPDKAAGNILEGRAVIVVDGSPFVLIVPSTFTSFINSPEDYYERAVFSSILRLVRYMSYFLATSLQAVYLAVTAYHPGMIPTSLVLSIAGTRLGLSLPMFLEVFLMEFTLNILQEAATRLPRQVGQTVSIVGGLVIGQAVVQAGIVSPVTVIVVAMTAIASFTIPVYSLTLSTRVIRLVLITAASILGLYGIIMVWLFLLVYMASIENFGVRYFGDFSPISLRNMGDTLIKVPKSQLNMRPSFLQPQDITRQKQRKRNDGDDG